MASALIGSSGFVGSHLLRQAPFDATYTSRNIEDIAGHTYDLVVCAGAPAAKWIANREPERDRDNLHRLMDCMRRANARQVVLISTVDVYAHPRGVNEDSPIDAAVLQPYGRHRFELERFIAGEFDSVTIRLPGLFGTGLKKNAIYDLLHGNDLDKIHCDGVFQFYDLENLWKDIQVAQRHRLRLVNFATEPTSVRELAREAFGIDFHNTTAASPPAYDVTSRHAGLYGGSAGYLYDRQRVLAAMRTFVEGESPRVR